MLSLTTLQRDLLRQLLAADTPLSAATLGDRLNLTPRQVRYGLRDIKIWLSQYQATLRHTPGRGIQIICTVEQKQRLIATLAAQSRFQLILTPDQRQQLLALQLLVARAPIILGRLQHDLAVARATVLKDIEPIAAWVERFGLSIARRQHRGFWIDGPELARRQTIAAMLWGDVPFAQPIMTMRDGQQIMFILAEDSALLPAVGQINALVQAWDLSTAQQWVTLAETELGGRFVDDVVAPLALGIAIQRQRIFAGQHVIWKAEALRWIQRQATWHVAERMVARQWPGLAQNTLKAETAALALLLTAEARDDPWPDDLGTQPEFRALIERLMQQIAETYAMPELIHDELLRDGLRAHVLPACVRQRFSLWTSPKSMTISPGEHYSPEGEIVAQVGQTIETVTGLALPANAHDDIILLVRAALVRARPERSRRILVVCPSGMATTQLLVARLKARLPRLGSFEVVPARALTAERIADADLIIATVPLELPPELKIDIIQVHPMLHPEDIVALTQWMA